MSKAGKELRNARQPANQFAARGWANGDGRILLARRRKMGRIIRRGEIDSLLRPLMVFVWPCGTIGPEVLYDDHHTPA